MPWDSQAVIREAGASLVEIRRPIDAERAERAQRIAARRAANAARAAHAHQVAMAAEWQPSRVSDAERDANACRRRAWAAVTVGFEGHPRTMAEVLQRAAAHQARAGARA